MKLKDFLWKYKHALLALYFPFYMLWFVTLEKRTDVKFTNIHCIVDDWIPFCEFFIIPYLLWFLYVLCTLVFLFFQLNHLDNFYHTVIVLISGMTICLAIYTIFPNAQNMRPTTFTKDNIFIQIITILYRTDTDTNVLPSIHVYNSLAIHGSVCRIADLYDKKWLCYTSLILCVAICLSTMFLKQHSFLDVVTAVLLYFLVDTIVRKVTKYPAKEKTKGFS